MRYINLFITFFLLIQILLTGKLVFGWNLIIDGSISEMYDDNIFADSENKEYDLTTSLMIGIGVLHEKSTQSLALSGHINQELYFDHNDLNNNSQDFSLIYNNELSNYNRFIVSDTLHHDPEPRGFEEIFDRRGVRNSSFTNSSSFSFYSNLTRRFTVNPSYTYEFTRHLSGDEVDSWLNIAGLSVGYMWNSMNNSSINYNFTRAKFDTGEVNFEHISYLLHTYSLTRRLHFNISSGLTFIQSDEGAAKSPYIAASAIHEQDENNNITISFVKEKSVSAHTDEIVDNWRISGEFNRQLNIDLVFSFVSFYGYSKYVPSNTTTGLFGSTVSFNYEIRENITGGLSYTFTNNDTRFRNIEEILEGRESNKYYRNQILLTLMAEF